jgi:adenylate cyclase
MSSFTFPATMTTTPLQQNSSTRNLTVLYIASLSFIAGLSILGQVFIQRSLSKQETDLKIVGIAHKQQTLSQELSKNVLGLQLKPLESDRQQYLEDINKSLTHWKESRKELELLQTARISDKTSSYIREILKLEAPSVMQRAAKDLMSKEKSAFPIKASRPNLPALVIIQKTAKGFVQDMDKIILAYNEQTKTEVKKLQLLETGLLSLTLVILILEGLLVFRPAVKKINEALTALAKSLQETQQTATKLASEQQKSEHLLLNILPEPIAERLKEKPGAIADAFAEVTVLFADIVGFTQLSTTVSPQELVALLNRIFSAFDYLAEKHDLEKIKTIGDAYMVVGGLPNPREDHAEAIINMALDMQEEISKFNIDTNSNCSIRIGVNTGPVVAGVIGVKKFIYDLWGDTVNTASRMESHGIPGNIQITATTHEKIKDKYNIESRGVMEVKGKGEMVTYFVKRKIN